MSLKEELLLIATRHQEQVALAAAEKERSRLAAAQAAVDAARSRVDVLIAFIPERLKSSARFGGTDIVIHLPDAMSQVEKDLTRAAVGSFALEHSMTANERPYFKQEVVMTCGGEDHEISEFRDGTAIYLAW